MMLHLKHVARMFTGARRACIASSAHGTTAPPQPPPGHTDTASGSLLGGTQASNPADVSSGSSISCCASGAWQIPPTERTQDGCPPLPLTARSCTTADRQERSESRPPPQFRDTSRDAVYPCQADRSGRGTRRGNEGPKDLRPLLVPLPEPLSCQSSALPLVVAQGLRGAAPSLSLPSANSSTSHALDAGPADLPEAFRRETEPWPPSAHFATVPLVRQSASACAISAHASECHVSDSAAMGPLPAGADPGVGAGAALAEGPELLPRHGPAPPLSPGEGSRQRRVSRQPAMAVVCQALATVAAEAEGGKEGVRLRRSVGEALSSCHVSLEWHDLCSVLKKQSNPHIAMGLFEWAKGRPNYRPHTFVYTTLIGVLGVAGETDLMARVHAEMKAASCKETIVTFSRLLHAYARNNMVEEALAVYGELQSAGMAPNRVIYGTLIGMWSKAGQHERVIEVFEEMREAKLEPDAVGYNVLLNSYKRMGEQGKGVGQYRRMLGRGLKPNVFLYNTCINLHVKAGHLRSAVALFHEMRADGVEPDVHTYSTLIHLYGKASLYEDALELFAEMQAAGHAPNEVVWATLIRMWGRAGDAKRAALYFHRMLEAGLPPSETACNALTFALLRTGMVSEVRAVFDWMRRAGTGPSLKTYTLLLSHAVACVGQADLGVLLELMEAMEQPLHAVMVKLLREPAGDAPEHELEAAVARGLAALPPTSDARPRRAFIGAAIDFLRKFGCEARAAMVWSQARQCNIFPNALTYSQQSPEGRWALDLHAMSPGTAATVTLTELRRLRGVALGGGPFPCDVRIITGWGRRSRVQGQSQVKQEVMRVLGSLGSPFREVSQNIGQLDAPAAAVQEWLQQPHLEAGLALRRTPPA